MSSAPKSIVCIGSGPGIGRSVTTLFASKGYTRVALIARSADRLAVEAAAVTAAVPGATVKTYALDVVDTAALVGALSDAKKQLGVSSGAFDCVFYNAARVLPSQLLAHDIKDIEYDFKINVSALYAVAQHEMPGLVKTAEADPVSKPAFIVTNSLLPQHPIPQLFALSLVKAAQRNMVQSMHLTYAPGGVHVGLISVGGQVSPDSATLSPTNIAARTWEWYEKTKDLEVVIL